MARSLPDQAVHDFGRKLSALDVASQLRPYQLEGIHFLANSEAALLADEMGLGKTVQAAIALRMVLERPDCDRALIVVPASLRLNWERELSRWSPNLVVHSVQGADQDRIFQYRLPIPVIIATYDQIRVDASRLHPSVHFDLVVLDEAQRIKNPDSATSLACRRLPRGRSWALTGTPVENSPDDLVAIFRFLKPGLMYRGLPRFVLHDRMRPYFLRRTKRQVLSELPPIIVQDLPIKLGDDQRESYDRVWASRVSLLQLQTPQVLHTSALGVITRLKQICNFDPETGASSKLETLFDILDTLISTREKIIIFSQFVETLQWLSQRIDNLPHDLLHGGQSPSERDKIVSTFQEAPGPRGLLASLRASGVGLNLQAANIIVMFDRWWNPAIEDQAIHRGHRFGRKQPLHVFRFVTSDTIEERIADMLEDKRQLFEEFIGQATSANVPRVSTRDLLSLLDLSLQAEEPLAAGDQPTQQS